MDLNDDTRSLTLSVASLFEELGRSKESICGGELADILSAFINEPVPSNSWVSGPIISYERCHQ